MENSENNPYTPANDEDRPRASPMNSNAEAAKAVTGILSGEGSGEPVRRETEEADREILAGTDDQRVKTGAANADAAEREEFAQADAEVVPEPEEDALGTGSGDVPTVVLDEEDDDQDDLSDEEDEETR
ncbi:hypothetical protein [Pedobacter sp. SYP-B3415]|uniref:hypothetical protein n=1 Tax=Pedobacter sp. SYP-B3415 TaxID=2496641 RepID=UPI00101DFE84|nr:hypothetical protein [Pedobacter sp. SYP-B3415]